MVLRILPGGMCLGFCTLLRVVAIAVVLAACGSGGGAGGNASTNGGSGNNGGNGNASPGSPGCPAGGATGTLTVNICNLVDHGVTHSGFLIGTASGTGLAAVQVNLDNTGFAPAIGTTSWSVKLPSGGGVWHDNSSHTIAVQSIDGSSGTSSLVTITVRKGVNHDVNGDGYADFVVGAIFAGSNNTGEAYVFQSGGSTGVTTGTAPTTTLSMASSTHYGTAVALGDVNGDGFADVIVTDNLAASGAGAVYVYNSRGANGIANNAAPNTTLTGAVSSTFGQAVAVGDVNGDGYEDVVVGSPLYVPSANPQGAVFIFPGGSSGVTTKTYAGAATTLVGAVINSTLGASVAVGDVNNDGYADVLAGAYGTSSNKGAAFIYHSSASGIANGATPTTSLNGNAGSNEFGFSVALGDVDGDGYQDAIIAAPGISTVYVFKSSASGISTAASPTATLPGTDTMGASLAAGDVNGDGYADVIAGAAGFIFIFQSSGTAGISSVPSSSASATLTSSSGQFGAAVGAADLNGDGCADLVAGDSLNGITFTFLSAGSSGVASGTSASDSSSVSGQSSSEFGISVGSLGDPFPARPDLPVKGWPSLPGRISSLNSALSSWIDEVDGPPGASRISSVAQRRIVNPARRDLEHPLLG